MENPNELEPTVLNEEVTEEDTEEVVGVTHTDVTSTPEVATEEDEVVE